MADNITEVLKNLVSGMDKESFAKALPAFKKIMATPEGRELMNKIKKADTESLAKLLKTLKSGSDPAQTLNHAAENPEYIKNLSALFEREVQ